MEDSAGFQCPEHGYHLFEAFLTNPFAFIGFLSEGLYLMKSGETVLKLGIKVTHYFLGFLEIGADFFCKYHTGDQDERYGSTGNYGELPVYGQKYYEYAEECNKVRDEIRDHMEMFLYKCNNKLERGMFVVTDDGMILFRTHMSCREGDVLSLKSVMEEVNLGVRMFLIFMGSIVRAMDGEKFEEIFEEADKVKGINGSGELPSEDVYVPAAEEKMSKVTEGMYV